MGAIIFNGALANKNQLMSFQKVIEEELEKVGLETESFVLNQIEIKSCIGCFRCWDTTPGICTGVKGDNANEIVEKVIQSNLVVFLTPLTLGGYSSELKKIIERCLGLVQPGVNRTKGESHHRKRYDNYPSLIAIAATEKDDEEEEELFRILINRHSKNFYPPQYRTEIFRDNTEIDIIRSRLKQTIESMELVK